MKLTGLLPLARGIPGYRGLLDALHASRPTRQAGSGETRGSVREAAKPYLLASLYRDLGRPMVVLTSRAHGARELQEQMVAWLGEEAVVALFPEPDSLPYERLSSDPSTRQQRLRVLGLLSGRAPGQDRSPPLVVTSVAAAMLKTLPKTQFDVASHEITVGIKLDPLSAIRRWMGMGYQLCSLVEVTGTMARRGGILDIYSPQSELPARIELAGDRVESIRFFEPATQRSTTLVPSIMVIPAAEVLAPDVEEGTSLSRLLPDLALSSCTTLVRERMERDLGLLVEGQRVEEAEFYRGLFSSGTFLEYLPPDALLVVDELEECRAVAQEWEEQAQEMRQGQLQRGELPARFPVPYFPWPDFLGEVARVPCRLALQRWEEAESSTSVLDLAPMPAFGGRLRLALREVRQRLDRRERVVIVSHQASRLSELLEEEDVVATPQADLLTAPPPGALALVQGSLSSGWAMPGSSGEDGTLALLTDAEIFGFVKQPRRAARKKNGGRAPIFAHLAVGDYVVHIDHGIGRFAGMLRRRFQGAEREYLLLEYAEGDRLYVPSDQVDRVERYVGPGGYQPALSRLGTQEWSRVKERVRQSVGEIAKELLVLYAHREVVPGLAFSSDTPWQQELEASFPYVETPDQIQAIQEVKRDMERPKPMDRVVCGDVGYGKTEVALRAAFKAVMEGTQVALLVPTTVLAQQHFATFQERLGAFPVTVEMLSRFRSDREQREVVEGLERGTVDVCIGTHRLLQRDVAFKNLGLIIVDEEQRFGVAHKEHFKRLRRQVDVLTLSATPIPRTLHMSLVGVRDMSTMETPPEERLPIKTYVTGYDDRIVREAILREVERGGQVFFVHNRVQSIATVAARLRNLAPEARFAIAHGQMPEEKLEQVMLEFTQGQHDVLICTTIIESGLDLPNVNTLIVNQADKLGLAQLYQLRGRVGRGAYRAYAYLLYDRDKALSEPAQKRLQAIFEATELGAGFGIALKDLEIRGAGNLLGVEQSGHISAVGFDLYTRLLAEAVEEVKASAEDGVAARSPQAPALETTVHLPLTAYLPEDYVSEMSTRLELYRRLAEAASLEATEKMGQELRDRFGPLPPAARNLLLIVRIKVLAVRAGVRSITTEEGQIMLQLREDASVDRTALEREPFDKSLDSARDRLRTELKGRVRIGHTQVHLPLASGWQEALMRALEVLAP